MSEKAKHVQHHVGHLDQIAERRRSAARICSILRTLDILPRSVIDVGCGYGFFLAEAQDAWSLERMLGIDGPWVEQDRLLISRDSFWVRDLQAPVPVHLPGRFDLAACLEVGEHLGEAHARGLVELLATASDLVLFSAAIPDQGGRGHLNEQYPSYWCSRFAEHGYVPIDILHPIVWTDSQLFPWFRQNLLIFVAEARLGDFPRFAAHRPPADLLDRVHPHMFQRRSKQLREAKMQLQRLEAELAELKARSGPL